jgi:hypothetical protein
MYAVAGLDTAQLERYAIGYRAHMARTLQVRRDIVTAMVGARSALEQGDPTAERRLGGAALGLWSGLFREDEAFDEALGSLLDDAQLARYATWKRERREGAEMQQRLELRARPDGSGGTGDAPPPPATITQLQ